MNETEERVPRKEKLLEAVKRLNHLNINKLAVQGLIEANLIPFCFSDVDNVYGLMKASADKVKQFEDQNHALVFFVIHTNTNLGNMESYLYVSDDEDEWSMDRSDMDEGYAMTWTENLDHPECSEFGSIAIERTNSGGLKRVM